MSGSLPPAGSFVRRLSADDAGPAGEIGHVVHHLDDSPDRTGPLSVVIDFETEGIGIYLPDEVSAVPAPTTFRGAPL